MASPFLPGEAGAGIKACVVLMNSKPGNHQTKTWMVCLSFYTRDHPPILSKHAKHMARAASFKIALSSQQVPPNLRFQFFKGTKLSLIAQAAEKAYPNHISI